MEGDLLEDLGTYQKEAKKARRTWTKKDWKRKRLIWNEIEQFADILSQLNASDEELITATPKTTKRPKRRGHVLASGCRLVDNPPHDVVSTPKQGKILL